MLWEGEVFLYIHWEKQAAVALHRPLGVSGDSRDFIAVKTSVLRCMVVEVLMRVGAYVKGEGSLDELREYQNAQQAAYNFEATRNFAHQSKRAAAAMGRQAMTPEDVNAVERCNLAKSIDLPEYPLFRSNRLAFNGLGRNSEAARPVDHFRIEKARVQISKAKVEADLVDVVKNVNKVFEGNETRLWKTLYQNLGEESPLALKLKTMRDKTILKNKGNRTKKLGADLETVEANCDEFLSLVAKAYTAGYDKFHFWAREKQVKSKEERSNPIQKEDLPVQFQDDDIVKGLSFTGIQSKFKKRVLKLNTS